MRLIIYIITVAIFVVGIFLLVEEKKLLIKHKLIIPVILILILIALYHNLTIITEITRIR